MPYATRAGAETTAFPLGGRKSQDKAFPMRNLKY